MTISQSQPCHWRNIKSVSKRDVGNQTYSSELLDNESSAVSNERREKSVSDNISLFKSLRVLQEGEGEDPLGEEVRSKFIYKWKLVILDAQLIDNFFDFSFSFLFLCFCRNKRNKWNLFENHNFVDNSAGKLHFGCHSYWFAVDGMR